MAKKKKKKKCHHRHRENESFKLDGRCVVPFLKLAELGEASNFEIERVNRVCD